MEKPFVMIEKRAGQTPLQALEEYRSRNPELRDAPMTYAGRLDPMAEGKLLILIGDECKKKDAYLGFDKQYDFEIVFALESDSGDVLGIPRIKFALPVSENVIKEAASSLLGEHSLPYPAYSSKTVGGKPLFHYASNKGLEEIELPARKMIVREIDYKGTQNLPKKKLLEEIMRKIDMFDPPKSDLPNSGFRKEEIRRSWENISGTLPLTLQISKFTALVSSGTYIRVLAPLLAKKLGMAGLAYSIKRTSIVMQPGP